MDRKQIGYAALTNRVQQVMALAVCGLFNKQVGGRLGISEITVKAHRGGLTEKKINSRRNIELC
ncbi:MAG TPA: LuxR C-terminal-related transcriptional regulator [Candidatus Acidoferrales bacterium]